MSHRDPTETLPEGYAERIAPAMDAPRPLPDALRLRLRSLPENVAHSDRTPGTAAEQLFADAVADARSAPPRPLPPGLRRNLVAIPRAGSKPVGEPHRPPSWLLDGRLATAACALLATLLSFSVGDASALLRSTVDQLDAPVASSAGDDAAQELGLERLWGETRAELADSWNRGRDSAFAWLEIRNRDLRDSSEQWSSRLDALRTSPVFRSKKSEPTDTESQDPPGDSQTQGSQP
jgi:hypothetical protein